MPTWLTGVAAAVVIVGFLGTTVVYLLGSRDKGTIQTLERSNAALVERVAILESNETRLETRVGVLERENANLRAQRPSAEAIEEIHDLLLRHIEELRHHDIETRPLLMAITAQLGELLSNGPD